MLGLFAAVATVTATANLAMMLVFGAAPVFLRRAEVLDPAEYQRVGGQIAAAERDLSEPHRHDARPLVVVLGLSTAREDIDAAALGPKLCPPMRVLNLGSSGSSYRELAFYLRTLPRTHLHSALTLLAVHPVWLAERRPTAASLGSPGDQAEVPSSPKPIAAARAVARHLGWSWLSDNRRGMHAVFRNALAFVRERIGDVFQLDMRSRFPDRATAPWAARIAYHELHAPPAFMDQQLRAWREYGWFDAANYTTSGAEAESLRQLVTEARALGGHVTMVLLPEQSFLRQRVPSAADSAFRQVLRGGKVLASLDLRARLPDEMFYDYVHANAQGRAHVTTLLSGLAKVSPACAD